MDRSNIDDYLEKGMYGEKQTKPEERKKFLGTLRERIVVALTKGQVMEKGTYPEVVQLMKEHPEATLLLNGDLDYTYLSDYIAMATKNHLSFSIVTNRTHVTDIGLVLTYDYAIDKEDIYISPKKEQPIQPPLKKKKGILSGIKGFFKK
ncbi:YueI family protein [Lederbergia sp. NSJ-179]|uniref:YueI family protein n=1 Tax=Lederbergia sp. NSJ-179 TaxID=2931402 RepID=UPI001FD01BF6|nr:YueI family protein [Lederbergia sp. NSJ-179]MCJ7839383.1 YueI family protein [Lederbergia sp. NSJ-179]